MWYMYLSYIHVYAKTLNLVISHRAAPQTTGLKNVKQSSLRPARRWSFYLGLGPGGKTGFRDSLIFSSFIVDVLNVLNVLVTWFSASIWVMSASGKMWSIWARPGKQKDMEGLYLCVELFSWQANPKEPSLRSPTQSQCLCDPNRRENIENSIEFCEFSGFTGIKTGHVEPTGHLMRVLSVPLVIVEFLWGTQVAPLAHQRHR